jgi:hypothetical protein
LYPLLSFPLSLKVVLLQGGSDLVDVALLVQITGAYAGLAIMFIFPTVFVHAGRRYVNFNYKQQFNLTRRAKNVFGDTHMNPYKSPFSHPAWIYVVYVWAVFALGCQIYRQATATRS